MVFALRCIPVMAPLWGTLSHDPREPEGKPPAGWVGGPVLAPISHPPIGIENRQPSSQQPRICFFCWEKFPTRRCVTAASPLGPERERERERERDVIIGEGGREKRQCRVTHPLASFSPASRRVLHRPLTALNSRTEPSAPPVYTIYRQKHHCQRQRESVACRSTVSHIFVVWVHGERCHTCAEKSCDGYRGCKFECGREDRGR